MVAPARFEALEYASGWIEAASRLQRTSLFAREQSDMRQHSRTLDLEAWSSPVRCPEEQRRCQHRYQNVNIAINKPAAFRNIDGALELLL
jgi:hypothetical protein